MIQVKKNLGDIPKSLNSKLTKQRRNEIIEAGCYPTDKNMALKKAFFTAKIGAYNSRYKHKDVKERLEEKLYYWKCAYCEQRIEGYHVEHYRPKSIYYWLAYSWDNLLFCCSRCNQFKLNFFEVKKRVTIGDFSITDIHNLGKKYDKYEQPKFINPEKENIEPHLIYDKKGQVTSNNVRVKYTIGKCQLNRLPLSEWRRRIYDDFEEEIIVFMGIIGNKNTSKQAKQKAEIELALHITKFVRAMNNPKSNFTSFRRYIFNNWLKNLYKLK